MSTPDEKIKSYKYSINESSTIGGGSATGLPEFESGTIIADRYKIIDLLGRGGMGAVYKVEQIFLHKQYALKTLDSTQVGNTAWRRFQTEAKAASMLEHPNLIKVLDFGLINESQPYFVMDYFGGKTLRQMIQSRGPLHLEEALDIFIQVAEGLAFAHQKGVIHRDIKPSNIMLVPLNESGSQNIVKILDFGIAKLILDQTEDAPTLTRTGDIFGTPFYMSPEQCLGIALDHRADLYSLGCVMFETLCGTPPFMGDSPLAVMMKHQSEQSPTMKEATLGKKFSASIEYVVAKLLAKDPRLRYQNAHALIADLHCLKAGQPLGSVDASSKKEVSNLFLTAVKFAVVSVAVITLCAGTFWAGRYSAPRPTPQAVEPLPSAKEDGNTAGADSLFKGTHGTLPIYFSAVLPGQKSTRVFNFPLEGEYGEIVRLAPETKVFDGNGGTLKPRVRARGTIVMENFRPFAFFPGPSVLSGTPDILSHFRDDEVSALDLKNNYEANDNTLKAAKDFKEVHALVLFGCEGITGAGLKWARQFPLTLLDVDGAKGLRAPDVAQLNNLRSLQIMRIKGLKHADPVLEKMQGSPALKFLKLRMCDPNVHCLEIVTTFPNLETLDLSSTKTLSSSLPLLKSMKHLKKLCVQGTDLSDREVLELAAALPQLKTLEASFNDWTAAEREQLKAVLPNARLYRDYESYSDADVPGNRLQDPRPDEPRDEEI